ncbi:30S ribosomal protein S27e [archaeon BMS3Bbin15]|nr:30S ribosomal protein S27e [archaeon BMS3Bbin15]
MEELISNPRSRFLKVKCSDCGNEQVMFGSASTRITCQVCGKTLAEPTGGKAKILTKIISVLE